MCIRFEKTLLPACTWVKTAAAQQWVNDVICLFIHLRICLFLYSPHLTSPSSFSLFSLPDCLSYSCMLPSLAFHLSHFLLSHFSFLSLLIPPTHSLSSSPRVSPSVHLSSHLPLSKPVWSLSSRSIWLFFQTERLVWVLTCSPVFTSCRTHVCT